MIISNNNNNEHHQKEKEKQLTTKVTLELSKRELYLIQSVVWIAAESGWIIRRVDNPAQYKVLAEKLTKVLETIE
jgi:hypothetical protein